jgi:hypothetical protein
VPRAWADELLLLHYFFFSLPSIFFLRLRLDPKSSNLKPNPPSPSAFRAYRRQISWVPTYELHNLPGILPLSYGTFT